VQSAVDLLPVENNRDTYFSVLLCYFPFTAFLGNCSAIVKSYEGADIPQMDHFDKYAGHARRAQPGSSTRELNDTSRHPKVREKALAANPKHNVYRRNA
jgi:hypothetical protein